MPTFWTKSLIPTLRQNPGEAEAPSHQLMLRAGLIRQLGSGAYSYLPLGLRSLRKAMQIIREEMDRIGAAEVFLPTLQPIDLWERTQRREAYGDNLFVVKDRHHREQALGPTHEEVVTDLIGRCVESYRDLPKTVYQIQTKFRDEFRPRFGVMRSREFQMKDAYSFHVKLEGEGGLDETYDAMYAAYQRIFERCGIPYEIVEAESGPIGGSASHEFMIPSPTGEDTILSNGKGYSANVEKAETGPRKIGPELQEFISRQDAEAQSSLSEEDSKPMAELEEVETPSISSIEDLCKFWKISQGSKLKAENTLKTLVCKGNTGWVLAVVRGDHELNVAKLRLVANDSSLDIADEEEAKNSNFPIGYVGPHAASDRLNVSVIADYDVTHRVFWVTGGNKNGWHVKGFDWERDLLTPRIRQAFGRGFANIAGLPGAKTTSSDDIKSDIIVDDIRNAVDGDPAPDSRGGGTLTESKGIEVGHIFKLGTKYTTSLDVTVSDDNNEQKPVIMGCYGIGVNRILAGAIEAERGDTKGHDEAGIIWPAAIAPFTVLITPIKFDGQVKEQCLALAEQLEAQPGVDVLIDDRDERPGPKFKDADLIGIPLRITIGDKGLGKETPVVELKARDGSLGDRGTEVPVGETVDRVMDWLSQ